MPSNDEKEKTNSNRNKSSNEVSEQQKEKLAWLRQQRADEAAIRLSNSNKKESKASDDESKKQKEKLLHIRQERRDEAAIRLSNSNKKESKASDDERKKQKEKLLHIRQERRDEAAIRLINSDRKDSKSLRRGRQQYKNVGSPRIPNSKTNLINNNNKESTTATATATATSTTTSSVEVGAVAVRRMNFEDDDAVEDFSTDDDAEGNCDAVALHLRQTSSPTYSDVQMNRIEMCSSSSSSSSQLQLSCDSDSQLPTASPVDMDALKAQYNVASRDSILQRMKAEMTVADEVIGNNDNVRSTSRLRMVVSTVAAIIIAIVISVVFTSTKKQEGMDKNQFAPTTSPTFSNFINLQKQMKSISGDSVFDESSPQYKALSWLTYEDSFILDFQSQGDFDDELVDRYILAVLYFSTGGPNWLNDLSFLTNSSVCEWNKDNDQNDGTGISHGDTLSIGVHCDNRGVTKILLDRNKLNGTIPFEIGTTLKYVDEISIVNNYIFGTIPSSFGNLFRLDFLDVSSNVLSGPIPTSFSHLTKLEYFSTRYNHLTGPIPSGITNLVSLERLDLSVNKLTGSIPEFSFQNSLEYLSIFNNLLDGPLPESLVELSHLEVLNLSNNFITGTLPSRLGMLENLSYLFLFENDISGSLPISIGNLDVLRDLGLDNNSLIGGIPSEIGKLTKLQRLYLDRNELSGTVPMELGQCTDLNGLYLQFNPELSGTIPLTFSNMHRLDEIVCPLQVPTSADCGGLSPKVNCTCCSGCCDSTSGRCQQNLDLVCDNIEHLAATYYGQTGNCTCPSERSAFIGFTCSFEECPTCNEDNTICGSLHKAGGDKTWSVFSITFHNTFQYTIGRNETIVWDETPEVDCNVSINGQQCNECSVHYCRDGFPARYIDCTNIVDVVDGGVYDTCQHYEKGGVLEYISWWDTFSWTGGCVPFYYISHQ